MRLNLLYQFNEKYAPYAGISIFSALQNNMKMEEIYIYILGEDLSEISVDRLQRMAAEYSRQILFIETHELILKMKAWDMPAYRGSYAANMRLFLDKILDRDVSRVLYLDADTIVKQDLTDLIQTDLQGRTLGMVLDSLGSSHKKQIGLSESDPYFNSGVILFDLCKWRERQYSEKIIEHVTRERNNYPAPDQDLLNIVCRNDIFRLDITYNFQPIHAISSEEQYYRIMRPKIYYDAKRLKTAERDVCIYHCFRFIGEFPWNQGNLHPFTAIFDEYLMKSLWSDYVKETASSGFLIRVEKILFRILPRPIFLCVFKVSHALFLYQSNRDALKNKTNKLM